MSAQTQTKKQPARLAAVGRVIAHAYGRDFDTDDIAKRAVRAADRITFSDEAIARAARAICPATDLINDGDWVCPSHYREAKAVADVLRKAAA